MSGMSSVHLTGVPQYRLAEPWRAHMAVLSIPAEGVEALAGLGEVVEAYLLLRSLRVGQGTAASHCMPPATPPFVAAPQPCSSDANAAPRPLPHGEAADAQALSAGNAGPKAGSPAGQGAQPRRAQLFVRSIRFRPLVPSRGFRETALHQCRIAATRCTPAICLDNLSRGFIQ